MALDLTGSADLAALFVLVTRAEIARAQVTDGPVVGISVVTACAGLAGGSYIARRATAGFDLRRSSVSGESLHGCVHADVADVCRGHSVAVGCADQNSFQIREHDHKIRPGDGTRSFGRQASPFVLSQRDSVGLRKIQTCVSRYVSQLRHRALEEFARSQKRQTCEYSVVIFYHGDVGLSFRRVRPVQRNAVADQQNVLVLVTLGIRIRGDMLRQCEVSAVTLHFVARENARQRPEQSAASAIRITIADLIHCHVQLEAVRDHVASSSERRRKIRVLIRDLVFSFTCCVARI